MLSIDLVKPWRIIVGLLPLLYGVLLLLELQQSWIWLVLTCGLILATAMAAGALGYSLLALWPAFPGLFCLVACVCALWQDLPDYGLLPVSDSQLELWIVAVIACAFIGWGTRTARQFSESY